MNVSESMKENVISISASATVRQAVARFAHNQIGMLPVVDAAGHLVGIVHLRDVVHLVMPAFVDLIEDFDYVGDFGASEGQQPTQAGLEQPVTAIMEPPLSVPASCGLLRAFSIIYKHDLMDLPIVDDRGRLVGLASRVDIGRALLATWRLDNAGEPS